MRRGNPVDSSPADRHSSASPAPPTTPSARHWRTWPPKPPAQVNLAKHPRHLPTDPTSNRRPAAEWSPGPASSSAPSCPSPPTSCTPGSPPHTSHPAGHQPSPPRSAPRCGPSVCCCPSRSFLASAGPRARLWTLARFGGTGAVALGSATISYGHLRDVLLAWQYNPLAAAVGPLVLDGLMVISGFALLAISNAKPTSATGDRRSPVR